MEYTQWALLTFMCFYQVLILVVMEYTQWGMSGKQNWKV